MTPDANDATLTRYLLGQMRPDEQASVEERYLTDPGYLDALHAAERDLIDRYVRGELSEPDAFEKQYLSSPVRRSKVEFARSLAQWSDRPADLITDRPASARSFLSGLRTVFRPWQVAAAVSIVLVGSWFVVLRQRQTPSNQAAPPSTRVQPQDVQPRAVATLVLMPNLTRAGDAMPEIVLSTETDARLELELESDGHARYQAAVRTADGREIWRDDQLKTTPLSSGPGLVITIPVTRLADEDYTIRVGGVSDKGEIDELTGYSFRVRIR